MRLQFKIVLFISSLCACSAVSAESVRMDRVDESGVEKSIGKITISKTEYGLVFTPKLNDLPPGLHGFHVHEHPNCHPAKKDDQIKPAEAAGGHYDPHTRKKHDTPWGDGHLGDLPALYVQTDGTANHPVLAPRLKMDDLAGRTLMIHAGGDNYSDRPAPLGGGGDRLACGVIEK